MGSIHNRLLLAASLILAAFLGIAGWVLETAFRDSAEVALQEKLQSHVYALLAAADVDAQGRMKLPEHLPEPRFSRPSSGLYAYVIAANQQPFWRSPSSIGRPVPDSLSLPAGQQTFKRHAELFLFYYAVDWEDDHGTVQPFTFTIAEQANTLEQQIQQFRTTLWSWLGGISLILLLLQGLILRWSLQPLREVATDLDAIRQGKSKNLQGQYPKELQGLTANLNALLAHDKRLQNRYRTTLDDLAHSLKTPLAYLASVLQDKQEPCEQVRSITQDQLTRMDHIIQHQLRRAAVSARTTLASPVLVKPMLQRLLKTLEKIYVHKEIQVITDFSEDAFFHGDEADFMEIFGNLLENAFKYANSEITITSIMQQGLELVIEDDGPGISSALWKDVLQRGSRADESASGQGIGLTVANEIILLYDGKLLRESSGTGGLRLRVIINNPFSQGSV